VPDTAGTVIKLAFMFLAAEYFKLYDRKHDANPMLSDRLLLLTFALYYYLFFFFYLLAF